MTVDMQATAERQGGQVPVGLLLLIAFLLCGLVVMLEVMLAGVYQTRWNTENQLRVACIEGRANAEVHALCVRNGRDK